MAEMKLMYAQSHGEADVEIWDYLPYHDAPEMTFDEAFDRYSSEDV
ncbi:hypothetical protein KTJ16_00400 [Acinetobacter bereziniae]|nr:hypothetical protein [Acinetobacter bereziniae]MCU4539640.1 hypothetical protein [Acinetobacter bereziniae]MCU4624181.1 hypothetical protein [Acinetobacter bereziniae]